MGKRLKKVAELATKFSVSGMTDIQKQPLVRIIRTTIFLLNLHGALQHDNQSIPS